MLFVDLGEMNSGAMTPTMPSHYLIAFFYRTDKANDFAIGVQLFKFIMSLFSMATIDVGREYVMNGEPAAQTSTSSMIWTQASGRPGADEDENDLRSAKWNKAGGSLGLLSWSQKGL